MPRPFAADNAFVRGVLLRLVDPATGAITPVTTGTVTGFLAASRTAAAPPDGTLQVNLVYIGNQPGRAAGTWMFFLPASVMARALLEQYFLNKRAYFICVRSNARRVVEEIVYADAEMATLAA